MILNALFFALNNNYLLKATFETKFIYSVFLL